jgi:hypothetical protein
MRIGESFLHGSRRGGGSVRGTGKKLLVTITVSAAVLLGVLVSDQHVAGASGGPGTMKGTPATTVAGSTGQVFEFHYVAPSGVTTKGTVSVTIPSGWTKPKTSGSASGRGHISLASKTCSSVVLGAITGSGPWVVPAKVSCSAGKRFVLRYGDVTVPTSAGADTFPSSFKSGGVTTPVAASPVVTVEPGPLDHLVLQGSASTIAPMLTSTTADYSGTFTSTYTAEGFDQYDNPIGDVTSDTTFTISPDGACSGSVCSVGAVGPHTVTGTDGSATGQSPLSGDYSALNMTCRGDNYDIDGDVTNGCEQMQSDQSTVETSATSLGEISCNDGSGDSVQATGNLLSDTRVHTNPAVPGFNSAVGSAPEWWSIDATGGTFCENDVVLTLTVTGSSHPSGCYELTALTDESTDNATTDATGTAEIDETGNQYEDGSTVYVEVQKTCTTATTTENVGYTIDGNL